MRRLAPALLAALGLVLVVAGVVTFAAAAAGRSGTSADFGWSAYTPLADEPAYRSGLVVAVDDRWAVLWTGRHLLGALLVVGGLLVLSAVGGWELGRRSAARR